MDFIDRDKELPLKPLLELRGKTFNIPYQQRGYKWTQTNVDELLCDLRSFIDNEDKNKRVYCLQPLAVVNRGDDTYNVLDGQQRLTTLFLLHIYLYNNAPYNFVFERDTDESAESKTMERSLYLSKIATIDSVTANENIDFFFIYRAYQQIKDTFQRWSIADSSVNSGDMKKMYEDKFKKLLDAKKEEKSIQVIWYEVPEHKKYDTFRNLNSGKIQLTNTELVKALLLNRVSGLSSKELEEAAAQFEHIEQEMQNDHFWYMFNSEEVRAGQTRMDMLFNLVSHCKQSDYDINPLWAFHNYFEKPEKGTLTEKWQDVRHTFLRLKDMYNDIYCYHYIGFLTYCRGNNSLGNISSLLRDNRSKSHSKFRNALKQKIKAILTKRYSAVTDYSYHVSKKDLRQLFLMHNIETILQKYETLRRSKQLQLQRNFEQFPFELLHKQNWDIEHIASNTDSDFKNDRDREDWLDSIKQDLGKDYPTDNNTVKMEENYLSSRKKESFDKLYKSIMRHCDAITKDSIQDDAPNGKDKMQIGNITLLDSHTNRSYHNALFPRKRHYVIVADGLEDNTNTQETDIVKLFIPICTRQVFTKAYNKSGSLTLNTWTQTDADAYVKDMEQKLKYYFEPSKTNKK